MPSDASRAAKLVLRVRLYRNLSPKFRKQRAWSIMAMEGPRKRKVIDIVDAAIIRNVTFVVSEAGRQRVLRDQQRNVHAFVDGELLKTFPVNTLPKGADGDSLAPGKGVNVRIGYNPYLYNDFMREDCGETVDHAALVVAAPDGVFAQLPPCRKRRGLQGIMAPTDVDGWNG